MNRFLIFQTWGIGDMIMSTPMISSLRQKIPEAHITIVAGTRAVADVIDGSPLCDEVQIMLPGNMSFYQLFKTFKSYRKSNFDAAIICTFISPHIANLLRSISGIKVIAGDCLPPKRWGYTHWRPFEKDLHRVDSNINILKMLFPDAKTGQLYFHIDQNSWEQADKFWRGSQLEGHSVLGIHPGCDSHQKNKRLPAEKFCTIIRMFLNAYPNAIVLAFLGPDELDLITYFSNIDERVIIVSNVPLRVVAGIISKLDAMLTSDSGLGHIATTLNVPVVTVAGPTKIECTKPWGNLSHVIRTGEKLPCIPCYYNKFLYNNCRHATCMKTISEVQVLEALSQYFE